MTIWFKLVLFGPLCLTMLFFGLSHYHYMLILRPCVPKMPLFFLFFMLLVHLITLPMMNHFVWEKEEDEEVA